MEARDRVSALIGPKVMALQAQMQEAQKKIEPVTASMLDETVKLAFRDSIKDSESVDVYGTNLEAAYADIPGFGAGKLSVIEASINGDA